MMRNFKTALLIGLCSFCTLLNAATFCVSNTTMLETVLGITQNNGQDDVIKIQSGNYIPENNFGFSFLFEENFDIEISGSCNSGCGEQSLNPLDTILNGDDINRVLRFFTNNNSPSITANISVSMLSINNGFYYEQQFLNSKSSGLSFEFSSNSGNHFMVDKVFFMGNRSNLSSALRAGGNKVTVRNSIFFLNESDSGTIYSVANKFYFINNTMISNTYYTQFNGGSSDAGLYITSFTNQAFVSNNVIWDNYGPDVYAHGTPTVYLYNNDYQSIEGFFDFQSGNILEDPQLGFLNFTPEISSPLVDGGYQITGIIPFPPPFHFSWSFGDFDFFSGERVVNNKVDIGAVEALPEVPIFINGFEQSRGG